MGDWNLDPRVMRRLFSWTPNFNPNVVNHTNSQCWIRIHGLPQEYWRPTILFAIAMGIGIPLLLHDATINKTFGHYVRILVNVDLARDLHDQILIERKDYAFFVDIVYEHLALFCSTCKVVGQSHDNCKKKEKDVVFRQDPQVESKKKHIDQPQEKNKAIVLQNDVIILWS